MQEYFNPFKKSLFFYKALIFNFLCFFTGYSQLNFYEQTAPKIITEIQTLHNKKMYDATQHLLGQSSSLDENTAAISVLNDLKNGQKGIESKIKFFLKTHPNTLIKKDFLMEIALYYQNLGAFDEALKWFQKIPSEKLAPAKMLDYDFYLGYLFFRSGSYTKAKELFMPIIYSQHIHQKMAVYYCGYIAYVQGDWQAARHYFTLLSNDKKYAVAIDKYLVAIEFKQKKYEALFRLGKTKIKDTLFKEKNTLYAMLAVAHYEKEHYTKAAEFALKYQPKKQKNKLFKNNILAHSYYKTARYQKAAHYFETLLNLSKNDPEKNQRWQYYLGWSYLKYGAKNKALLPFKKAMENAVAPLLTENAHYQYVALGDQIGNPFEKTNEAMLAYIKKYPQTARAIAMKQQIVKNYFNAQAYQEVIDYYENTNLPKDAFYQKAIYYKALKILSLGQAQQAVEILRQAVYLLFDETTRNNATYWLANVYYQQKQWQKSLQFFEKILRENPQNFEYKNRIYFDAGYVYLNLKNYEKAVGHFQQFISQTPYATPEKKEAVLRMGDAFFASSHYQKSLVAYDKAIAQDTDKDYAAYQKARCLGFLGKQNSKIFLLRTFEKKYPNSSYKDIALFTLANAYIQKNQNKRALKVFEEFIKNFPKNAYTPKVILKQALLYYNANQSKKAIERYKMVVKNYPKTKDAYTAIEGLRKLYIAEDKVEDYAEWVKEIGFAKISNQTLDESMFEAAEKQHFQGQTDQAIQSLEKYLAYFPKGLNRLKTHYYLSLDFGQKGNLKKALAQYKAILKRPNNIYTEEALLGSMEIYLQTAQKNDLLKTCEKILALQPPSKQKTRVLFEAMKAYYETAAYKKTLVMITELLKSNLKEPLKKWTILAYQARAYLQTGNIADAKKIYAGLEQQKEFSKLQAEAIYYKAYWLRVAKNYIDSNKMIEAMAAKKLGARNWEIKAMFLMAKNNISLGEHFQAKYILEALQKIEETDEHLKKEISMTLQMIATKTALNPINE